MSDREIDQQLVERAQRGDKHAFELLVSKYQRKLARLLSRFIRDSTEVEDVTQEAFIKAYRALPTLPGRQRVLYVAVPDRHQHRQELPGGDGATRAHDHRHRQRGSRRLRGRRPAARPEYAGKRDDEPAGRRNGEPNTGRTARRVTHRDHAARDRRAELRGHREHHELSDRHGAFEDIPRARGDRGAAETAARHEQGQEMVRWTAYPH